jgi:hypothetical protein
VQDSFVFFSFNFFYKNLLFDRESIGEMGLCVKKNKSQYMGVLGYPVARGLSGMR